MSPFWEIIKDLFKILAGRLLRPKDSKPLDDHSFRLTNIFSKNSNIIIVNLQDKKENLIANIEELPDNVKKVIQESFNIDKSKRDELPNIRLIKSDRSNFSKRIVDFQQHYEKRDNILDDILPHLRPEYRSILKLSSYVKEKFDASENIEAQKIKADIGNQYGRNGRKLCNLYTKSYIIEMISVYISKIFESTTNKRDFDIKLNNLFDDIIIRHSEYIFFIHRDTNISEVKDKIILGMESKKPYIALHSAGSINISITKKILKKISDDSFSEYNYLYKQEKQFSSTGVPFFDVYIKLSE